MMIALTWAAAASRPRRCRLRGQTPPIAGARTRWTHSGVVGLAAGMTRARCAPCGAGHPRRAARRERRAALCRGAGSRSIRRRPTQMRSARRRPPVLGRSGRNRALTADPFAIRISSGRGCSRAIGPARRRRRAARRPARGLGHVESDRDFERDGCSPTSPRHGYPGRLPTPVMEMSQCASGARRREAFAASEAAQAERGAPGRR